MNTTKPAKIYGYIFDCKDFMYNDKLIDGFCYTIKVPPHISQSKIDRNVKIQLSKKYGFLITIKGTSKNLSVIPHQMYAVYQCENNEEDFFEIDNKFLKKNKKYIIDGVSNSASCCWLENKEIEAIHQFALC